MTPTAPPAPSAAGALAFIKRHPVLAYYVLTFVISWGAFVMLVAGRTGVLATTEQATSLLPAVFVVTIAGPALASVLLTGLVYGRRGYRELLARLLQWRVDARWYAVALLIGPLSVIAAVFVVSLTSPELVPAIITAQDRPSVLLFALMAGLVVGSCEELGWTGFALPRLRARDGVFATGLLMGILWGVWHLPSQFWAAGDASGALALGILVPELVFALAVLPAYRVLMVWVYEHAHSLLVAMLMHAVLVASLFTMLPAGITGAPFLTCYLVVAVAVWIVVVAVGVATGGQFSRQPLRTRVA